jgi:hypothetical protein
MNCGQRDIIIFDPVSNLLDSAGDHMRLKIDHPKIIIVRNKTGFKYPLNGRSWAGSDLPIDNKVVNPTI